MKNMRQELLREISTALVLRNKVPIGWYYHILSIEGSNSGLASYLQMTNDEWTNLMLFCGLAKRVGKSLSFKYDEPFSIILKCSPTQGTLPINSM